jgi:thiamine biosynthesis lipoprotein
MVSHSTAEVRFGQTGMRIDLGGIGKGAMAEEAVRVMRESGLTRGIVDAGGHVVVFSGKGDPAFRVGIKNPTDPARVFAVLSVTEGAVVTSGCYERFVEIQGTRYCHIVDPRTGLPVSSDLLSVTVLTRDGAAADAYATGLYVLGPEEGFSLAKSLPELEAVFLIDDGRNGIRMKATPGLTGRIELVE